MELVLSRELVNEAVKIGTCMLHREFLVLLNTLAQEWISAAKAA